MAADGYPGSILLPSSRTFADDFGRDLAAAIDHPMLRSKNTAAEILRSQSCRAQIIALIQINFNIRDRFDAVVSYFPPFLLVLTFLGLI